MGGQEEKVSVKKVELEKSSLRISNDKPDRGLLVKECSSMCQDYNYGEAFFMNQTDSNKIEFTSKCQCFNECRFDNKPLRNDETEVVRVIDSKKIFELATANMLPKCMCGNENTETECTKGFKKEIPFC